MALVSLVKDGDGQASFFLEVERLNVVLRKDFLARNDPKTKELVLKSYLYKLFPLQWCLAVRW